MDSGQIVLFQTQGGETKIEIRLSDETMWLTADQMAVLFRNYIGEFFLFRWLFGSHRYNETKHDMPDTNISQSNSDLVDVTDSHIGFENRYDNSDFRFDNRNYGYSQSYNDFHNEQDDYDMMDDDFNYFWLNYGNKGKLYTLQ